MMAYRSQARRRMLFGGSQPAPVMKIYGNGVEIANGDNSPSLADDTDFGSTEGLVTVDKTYTIQNTGTASLTGVSVTVPTGFTLQAAPSATIAASGNTTFTIRATAAAGAFTVVNGAWVPSGTVTVSSNELPNHTFEIKVTLTFAGTFDAIWDFSDTSTLFEDVSGLDPAEPDDPIARVDGKVGVDMDLAEATLSRRPLRKDNIQNGLSVGRFDTTDMLSVQDTLTVTGNETIYIVAKHNTSGSAFGRLLSITGTAWGIFFSSVANRFQFDYNGSTARKDGGFTETDFNVLVARYNGTAIVKVNGVIGATTVTPAAASHTWNTVGARPGPADNFNGDIGILLHSSNAHSDAQVTFNEALLKATWGTP